MDMHGFTFVTGGGADVDPVSGFQCLVLTDDTVEPPLSPGHDLATRLEDGDRGLGNQRYRAGADGAHYLGVAPQAIYRWATAGRLPCIMIRRELDAS